MTLTSVEIQMEIRFIAIPYNDIILGDGYFSLDYLVSLFQTR